MYLNLLEAAKLAGVSKSTLYKAIKRGNLSGVRDDVSAEWRVDVAELQRVYPNLSTVRDVHSPARNPAAPWNAERQHYEARITALESERDYLRQALQAESEERRQLVRLLTAPQPSAEMSPRPLRTGWVWPAVGLVAVVVAVFAWLRMATWSS